MKTQFKKEKSVEIVTQNQVVFDLKDGTRLLLHKEDYETLVQRIRMDVTIQMMIDCPDRIYVGGKQANEEKIKSLYAILKEQSETMSDDTKTAYLKSILDLSLSNDVEAVTLQQINKKTQLTQK